MSFEQKDWVNQNEDGTIPDGAPALDADNLNRIENGIKGNETLISDKINELKGFLLGEVLWNNSTPSSGFAAQTIEMDLTEYKHFLIVFKLSNDLNYYAELTISEKDKYYRFGNFSNLVHYFREVKISNDGFVFDNGYTSAGSDRESKYCIPIKIIGYKY